MDRTLRHPQRARALLLWSIHIGRLRRCVHALASSIGITPAGARASARDDSSHAH